MRKPLLTLLAVLALGLVLALPLAAAPPSDPLALVPPEATTVGMLRVSDIRTSPYAARLFHETDHVTMDGDAERFLADAHLRPTEDVDTIVFAAVAGAGGAHGTGIAILEGRFEAAAVESALLARGGTKRSVAGGSLILLPEKHENGAPGALAFLDRHLAVAGPLPAVEAALAQAAAPARADFRTGAGLGRQLRRVPADATGWVLVDLSRLPQRDRHLNVHGEIQTSHGDQVVQIAGLMKQVPLVAMSATLRHDALKLTAFGACDDAETRGLLEDSLRGLLAAWRLSVQESKPDLVPTLRSFKVEQAKDGVSLTGSVRGAALSALLEKAH